jgi:hypothetical protein
LGNDGPHLAARHRLIFNCLTTTGKPCKRSDIHCCRRQRPFLLKRQRRTIPAACALPFSFLSQTEIATTIV